MPNEPIHTVPDSAGGWTNLREGATRGDETYDTKAAAQAAGREAAQRGQDRTSDPQRGWGNRQPQQLRQRSQPAQGLTRESRGPSELRRPNCHDRRAGVAVSPASVREMNRYQAAAFRLPLL